MTVRKLREAIPARLFERSALKSMRYVVQDLIAIALCVYVSTFIELVPSLVMRALLWPIVWWVQGAFMTGLWVMAHECGHQAFSEYRVVNDSVGFVIHSTLLVPYWAWANTHSLHHSNSNSMERDTVFVPVTVRAEKHSLFWRVFGILRMVTIGWWVYLLLDVAGPPRDEAWTSHFNPFCSLFRTTAQKIGCIASSVGLLAWLYVLKLVAAEYGWTAVLFHYFIPYVVVNFWLVSITFLQHSDPAVPKYYPAEWTWLRGALGTVDRDYGIFNIILHHITDTHVVHHIFSKMPFYHASEATEIIVKSGIISEYYLSDDTPWYTALWTCYEQCWVVEKKPVTFFLTADEYDKKEVKKIK
jgi:omega-6 fatty acid desaturase (delta-12 desaturase)